MPGELDIYGIFVPQLLVLAALAYIVSHSLILVLNRIGFYRFIWYRALFDVSLYFITLGSLSLAANGF